MRPVRRTRNHIMPKTRHRVIVLCQYLLLVITSSFVKSVRSDAGSCRYDEEFCSCRIGDYDQGVCWDPHPTMPNLCVRRYCKPGWTCSCSGRTHLCSVGQRSTHVLVKSLGIVSTATSLIHTSTYSSSSADVTAPCITAKSAPQASVPQLALGSLRIHISRDGVASNSCSQIAWWHNGELLGNHNVLRKPLKHEKVDIDADVSVRERHTQVELQHGDLIAFRFLDASYYCFKHQVHFTINGSSFDKRATSIMYSRQHSPNWFSPMLNMDSSNVGMDESEKDLRKFLPLRRQLLTTGEAIESGEDYWQPRDDKNADHRIGDFYFRVQILGSVEPTEV